MRCLVTGAGGFLGPYVLREGERRGLEMVPTGAIMLPSADFAALVKQTQPTAVVHLGAPASVPESFVDHSADFRGSVDGMACLLNAVESETPTAKIVLVSSAAVYGNPPALPIREDAPTKPLSPYGYHKVLCELLLEEACLLRGRWGAVARVFSAYGLGLRRQVVYELCAKVSKGEPLVLDGTGDESRDFVHAADVARAIFVLLERAPGRGERFNVATGLETRIRDLANLVAAAGRATPARFTGLVRAGDPARWRADISAICELGFSPVERLEPSVIEIIRSLSEAP